MGAPEEKIVRDALVKQLRLGSPTATVIQELPLREWRCIVDVAVITDELHAFEIKTSLDSVDRLPRQVGYYTKACHRNTAVIAVKHLNVAIDTVPLSWGLSTYTVNEGRVDFEVVREPQLNADREVLHTAGILRGTELRRIIRANNPSIALSALSKGELLAVALRLLGADQLTDLGLRILGRRKTWTARQLGVTTERERLDIARMQPLPELSVLMPQLELLPAV